MTTYPSAIRLIHWLTAFAVVVAYITSGDPTDAKSALEMLTGQVHVAAGLTVAVLVLMRLPLRLLSKGIPPLAGLWWQKRAAVIVHAALYVLFALVPFAGWAALSGKTQAFAIAGVALPLLTTTAPWVDWLGDAHPFLGDAFIWLAGLHAVAALGHHYLHKDDTLNRMLPWARRRST
jgi:superoxide oxidase